MTHNVKYLETNSEEKVIFSHCYQMYYMSNYMQPKFEHDSLNILDAMYTESWQMPIVNLLRILMRTSRKQLSIFHISIIFGTFCESCVVNKYIFLEIWWFENVTFHTLSYILSHIKWSNSIKFLRNVWYFLNGCRRTGSVTTYSGSFKKFPLKLRTIRTPKVEKCL